MLNISSSSKSQIEEEKVKATVSYINFVEMLLQNGPNNLNTVCTPSVAAATFYSTTLSASLWTYLALVHWRQCESQQSRNPDRSTVVCNMNTFNYKTVVKRTLERNYFTCFSNLVINNYPSIIPKMPLLLRENVCKPQKAHEEKTGGSRTSLQSRPGFFTASANA